MRSSLLTVRLWPRVSQKSRSHTALTLYYQMSTLVELHSCMYGGDFFVSSSYEE